ncbi:MerR family transcriptional regulator [Cohnella mopanensis]|uniref:MerR family transcriptional regulator n=1 Tax=Cohnella mopanensis TaxID=2911966 RepID=UPI001EF96770|nr:MerR family transcriptional regulator [Cohnella mopanensis]
MPDYLRGDIAKLANINKETLRYYEDLGIISLPSRSESGYRLYSEAVLSQLAFINNAKSCGFTLKEIKKALKKSESRLINLNDFIVAIDKKTNKIHAEIAKKEQTLKMLAGLKTNLQAAERHPDIHSTLRILNMED